VRFANTRTALPKRFVHRAAYYRSSDHLIEVAKPLAQDALGAGTPVALIASPVTHERLREVLGHGSAGLIPLPPPDPALRASGQAAVAQQARELAELTDWAGPVVVLAEHHPYRPGIAPSAWVEADAATNIALATLPITLTCLYPTDLALETVSAAIRLNHPELLDEDGTVRSNPDARPPAEVLSRYPVEALNQFGPPTQEMIFTPWQLIDLRAAIAGETQAISLPTERADDFVLAVNEVASNAVEHGCGVGVLRIWRQPDRVICEVSDSGLLREPLPGMRPPHPSSARGRGMWLARQMCDLLHVWTDERGTHVRLQAVRVPSPP
jgi:anti-sigma regulatory factor (Ser/Thr protein kinase)